MTPKQTLRQKIRQKLLLQNVKDRQKRSLIIEKKLFSLEAFKKAKLICFYVSLSSEVDTFSMIDRALKIGKEVVVPLTDVENKKLKLYQIKSRKKDLKEGAFGILEPDPKKTRLVDASTLDCVIVPGVVFDTHRHRIGRGRGFYDRFLEGLDPGILKIGLGFSFQVIQKIPNENHDQPVDLVLTDTSR
jgi:5-formyltetrahydrofolate cyclo-ligase